MRKEWCKDHKRYHVIYEPGDSAFVEGKFRESAVAAAVSRLWEREVKASGRTEAELRSMLTPFHEAFLYPCQFDLGCVLMNPDLFTDIIAEEFYLGFLLGRGLTLSVEDIVRERLEVISKLPRITAEEARAIMASEGPEVAGLDALLGTILPPSKRKKAHEGDKMPRTTDVPKPFLDAFKDEKEDK